MHNIQLSCWFNIINRGSELALDGNAHEEGSDVHQWLLHDKDNQKWCMWPASVLDAASGMSASNCYFIGSYDLESKAEFVLEASPPSVSSSNAAASSGWRVRLTAKPFWDDVQPNQVKLCQLWKLRDVEPGWVHIVSAASHDLVLDVCNASTSNGGKIHLWPAHNHYNQQWRLTPTRSHNLYSQFPFLDQHNYYLSFNEIGTKLKEIVDKHGFAVITDVVPPEELIQLEGSFGIDLWSVCNHTECKSTNAHCSINESYRILESSICTSPSTSDAHFGIDELDSSGFSRIPSLWPGDYTKPALSSSYGLPQGQFAWKSRLHPNVIRVYECLYYSENELESASNDLVVGLDCIFFKPKRSEHSRYTEFWGHVDINIHSNDINPDDCDVYQSILSIWPSTTGKESTTVVWPTSHETVYPMMMQDEAIISLAKRKGSVHYSPISTLAGRSSEAAAVSTSQSAKFVLHGSTRWVNECFLRGAGRVALPAGSLLVFDSRTVHQGWSEGSRLAMPICWEPRRRRSRIAFNRKVRLVASGSISTHWASLGNEHSTLQLKGDREGLADYHFVVGSSESPCLCQLPTSSKSVPYCIRPEYRQQYAAIMELCATAKRSDDTDEDIVRQLVDMLRPEIVAVL